MRKRKSLASALGPTPGCSSWCERLIRLAHRAFSHVFREGAADIRFVALEQVFRRRTGYLFVSGMLNTARKLITPAAAM
jgi:hypothetical protein